MATCRYEISLQVLKNIYYVATATVIFSRVKISSFRAKAHLVFHWCLYNKIMLHVCDIYVVLVKAACQLFNSEGSLDFRGPQ